MKRTALVLVTLVIHSTHSEAADVRYVSSTSVDERLCPSASCSSTNKIYRQQKVEVFELKDGWARVSRYYDGVVEGAGIAKQVVRWVPTKDLSLTRPPDIAQPKLKTAEDDPRISYLPKVGDSGLSAADVSLLRRYAVTLLKSGVCAEIDDGDKSVSKPGTYYVHCKGEMANRFFRAEDVR